MHGVRLRRSSPAVNALKQAALRHSFLSSRPFRSASSAVPEEHGQRPSSVDHGLSADAVKRTAAARLEALSVSGNDEHLLRRLQALNSVLARYPLASVEVRNIGGLDTILNIRANRSPDDDINRWARQACALLGHADPLKGRGLRILAIDGGGVRGVLAVFILEHLLKQAGSPPLGELFDMVTGTSIGALIPSWLMFGKIPAGPRVPQFLELFKTIANVTLQDSVANLVKYRAKFGNEMISLLNSHFENKTLISTARHDITPKLLVTACLLGKGRTPHPAPFLFRNYRPTPGEANRYAGGCNYSLTHACAASAAAPGYFPGVSLGGMPLKDGGLLGNNTLPIALHEARLLWGADVPIQCIVSIGTGLVPLPQVDLKEEFSDPAMSADVLSAGAVVDVIQNVVNSACNNQMMEHIMEDMLDSEPYHRFNPSLPYDYPPFADDIPELMKIGEDFVRDNDARLRQVAQMLTVD